MSLHYPTELRGARVGSSWTLNRWVRALADAAGSHVMGQPRLSQAWSIFGKSEQRFS